MPNTGNSVVSKHFFDHRNGIFAGRRRVAGAVGQEHAVGVMRQHLGRRRRRGQNGHLAAGRGQTAQDVAFGAIIECNDLVGRRFLPLIPIGPGPTHFIPAIALGAGDILGQIHTLQPGKTTRGSDQRFDIEITLGIMGQRHMRSALADGSRGSGGGYRRHRWRCGRGGPASLSAPRPTASLMARSGPI